MKSQVAAILITNLLSISLLQAQPSPGTQPATSPAARGGRGPRASVASSSRDQQPFSNSNIKNIKPELPTLFICGDSTAATGDPDHRGWGAVLVDYFDTSKINLVNYSQGGINFPGYYTSRWPAVVEALKPGDFVVVELGHNGGHIAGTGDETGPGTRGGGQVHSFGWYIRTFIRDARAKGATTIVSSTTTRYLWTNPNADFDPENGKLLKKKDNYSAAADHVERGMGDVMPDGRRTMLVWAEQVANEEKAPFVDHSDITADYYEKVGHDAAQKFHPVDRTHTSTEGAIVNAETFIAGLKALPDMKLVDLLNAKGKAIAAYKHAP